MGTRLSHTSFHCPDAYALSEWWKELLGLHDVEGDPNLPGHTECMIVDPADGTRLLFIESDDPGAWTGRLHLDLCADEDSTREAEVERALALGATMVVDRRESDGRGWAVLADPQGNQFCLVRAPHERHDG